jgi:hypothetical protein
MPVYRLFSISTAIQFIAPVLYRHRLTEKNKSFRYMKIHPGSPARFFTVKFCVLSVSVHTIAFFSDSVLSKLFRPVSVPADSVPAPLLR